MKLIQYITYPNGWFCVTNVSINIKNSSSMDALGIRSRVKYKTSPPQMFHAIFWESLPLTKFTHGLRHVNVTHHRRHRTRHTANSKGQLIPLAQLFHKLCLPHLFSWDFRRFPKQTREQKSLCKKKGVQDVTQIPFKSGKTHLDFFQNKSGFYVFTYPNLNDLYNSPILGGPH